MHDLRQQAAQPQFKYIAPALRGKSSGCRYECPNCKGKKSISSPLCRACSTASKRSPIDETVYWIDGSPCRRIPLNNSQYALVDSDLYDYLMQWRWRCYSYRSDRPLYVVTRTKSTLSSEFKDAKMHHLILGIPSSIQVDHRNRNALDNRRGNLRHCTSAENVFNRGIRCDNTSGYIGVKLRGRRYAAAINFDRKRISLGCFATAEEAARVRDTAALRFHGKFAVLNFPEAINAL